MNRILLGTFIISSSLLLSAKNLPIEVSNYLRLEWDDNVYTTGDGSTIKPIESWVILEQIEFLLDSQMNNSYVGIRYSPTFKYYDNRPDDDTDINNQWDFIFNHDFTPRTSFQLHHILRDAQEPELVQDDVTFRNNNDYMYNSVDAALITQVSPDKTSVQVSGRFVDIAYDDADVADVSDYQEVVGGFDVIQVLQPDTTLSGQYRYSDVDYEADFRDAETMQLGLELNKTFNPKLNGKLRAGYETHNPSDVVSQDTDSPYVDASMLYQPIKGNRFSLGAGFKQDKSPINTFTMQERFSLTGAYANDLTAAITLNLSGTYTMGNFSSDNATSLYDPAVDVDGDENILYLAASLSYNINVRNSMVLSYQYSELDSDVRADSNYDRNRVSLGWKYSL
jgi:hypothetical protein